MSLVAILLPSHAAPGREDLVIGQVAPLTGTIAGTGTGNEYVAGGAAYFAYANDKGGIYGRGVRRQEPAWPRSAPAISRHAV